jgi:hypothetical protein
MCAVLTVTGPRRTAKNLMKQPLCPVFALGTSQLQVMRVKYWANSRGEGFFLYLQLRRAVLFPGLGSSNILQLIWNR